MHVHLLACLLIGTAATDERLAIRTDVFQAQVQLGALSSLIDSAGRVYVRPPSKTQALRIHRADGGDCPTIGHGAAELQGDRPVVRRYEGFANLPGGQAEVSYHVEPVTGDLVISQNGTADVASVWGISWSIGRIPLEYAIIVPGRSGVRLTADAPGRRHQFDYPIGWEAQLVIVEGPGHGFFVWAEDTKGRYKRLLVERDKEGWRLELVTLNDAPFDPLTACSSVPWHLNTYVGDWRVPARHYRDWAEAHFQPTVIQKQRPAWVKDVRAMVIMGLDDRLLEALPERLDPLQTILYIPSWRAAGYDRDYPVYDQPYPKLQPFVERAHELGFRVMLHVNYFGVDPLNPVYQQFEPYQVRSPWGKHEKLWWLWTRAEPEIRFAYINPGHKAWRDYFTAAMVKLCHDYQIDSLHLDQTLVIFNDHNGRIEGMSMLEGNLALHRQLRAALPDVALSGEGLNEVTYRYEALAQRHAWGLSHSEGTWDRQQLALAHPICSYLFRRCTIINGYLGCAPPTSGQLYAAWNEAYEHWGVIPTLKPALAPLRQPTGFSRQFFDEARFWQQTRLTIDLEGEWPPEIAFPFRTADGHRAVRTTDGQFRCEDQLISRTISGVYRVAGKGTIPGWWAFDNESLFGLDPARWYPYFEEPRASRAFHVTQMPEGMIAEAATAQNDLAIVRVSSPPGIVADLVELLDRATVGSRPFRGQPVEATGPFAAPDGASFQTAGNSRLSAHPPWKTQPSGAVDAGSSRLGVAYARYAVDLPKSGMLRLVSEVSIDSGAVGQSHSDGVTFGFTAKAAGQQLSQTLHNASDTPETLELDLTALAGHRTEIELTVHPGPARLPSFDWARWHRPRIEQSRRAAAGRLAVAGTAPWKLALAGTRSVPLEAHNSGQQMSLPLPGTVILLRKTPALVELPADLTQRERTLVLTDATGRELSGPPFVGVNVTSSTVGGVARPGLFAHPPDHGQTIVQIPLTLPKAPAMLRSWIGIRDRSASTGVIFRVEINGQEVACQRVLPGNWSPIAADLSPWAGHPVVLSLITDSDGPYSFDWAHWGQPRLEAIAAVSSKE